MVGAKLKIRWSNEAKYSLRNIKRYISKRGSVVEANKVGREILKLTTSLSYHPDKYPLEPRLSGNCRYAVLWSYKILYEHSDCEIKILDIFHTAQNPDKIKALGEE